MAHSNSLFLRRPRRYPNTDARERRTTAKRAALWCFREIETLRRTLIQRAGRIIRPAGKLILSMNTNARIEAELRHALATLQACA